MQFYNNFIGYEPKYHNELFTGFDTEERFRQSLIKHPSDWYYRTHPISYIRNSVGHRSKEIDELDLNNYMLFAGCSITEGVGLELEKTYPHIVSSKMIADYYNIGLGGTGPDILAYNLIQWRNLVKDEPAALIIQWPNAARYAAINNQDKEDRLRTLGPWTEQLEVTKFLTYGESSSISYFSNKKIILQRLIKSLFSCPIIEIEIGILESFKTEGDFARDNLHPGIAFHLNIANMIALKI